jgi:hypothetical protein
LLQSGDAGLNLIYLLIHAIHLIGSFENFTALHFRIFAYGRVPALSVEGGEKS